MEDRHIIKRFKSIPDHTLLAVLDGHAGKGVSTYVSMHLQGVIEQTEQWLAYIALSPADRARKDKGIDLLQKGLVQAFCDMDSLLRQVIALGKLDHSGSTVVCTIVTPTHIVCASVGDSRCVVGLADGQAIALTEDHKPELPDEEARILKAGGIVLMNRVQGELAMSRALGDFQYKDVNIHQARQMVTCYPDVSVHMRTQKDAFLLLACDGVWDVMTNAEAIEFLHSVVPSVVNDDAPAPTSELLAEELIDLALSIGSTDNLSALVVKLNTTAKEKDQKQKGGSNNNNNNNENIQLVSNSANSAASSVTNGKRRGAFVEELVGDEEHKSSAGKKMKLKLGLK